MTQISKGVRTLFAALLLPEVEVRVLRLLSPVALQLLPLHLLNILIYLDFRRALLSESLLLLSEGQQSLLELDEGAQECGSDTERVSILLDLCTVYNRQHAGPGSRHD